MIPVNQTRHGTEAFGNCYEAAIASILEVPISTIPDRARYIERDEWADLVATTRRNGGDVGELDLPAEYEQGEQELAAWLARRGLAVLLTEIGERRGQCPAPEWMRMVARLRCYWIATTASGEVAHATVWLGEDCVHDPGGRPAGMGLGSLKYAEVFVAADPAAVARRLAPLPEIPAVPA